MWTRRLLRLVSVAQRLSADRRVQVGFVVITVAAATLAVILDRESVLDAVARLEIGTLALAFGFTLVNVLSTASNWRTVLADLGSRLSVPAAFRIFLVGSLGKYLPGSVWFLVAQTEMAGQAGVPRQRAASASIVALVLTVATALLAALIVIPVAPSTVPVWIRWTPLLLPVLVAALYPPLLNRVLNRVLAAIRRPPLEHEVSALGIVRAVLWSLLSWLAVGAQVTILAVVIDEQAGFEWRTLVFCLGGYALAWAVGFVAFFVPAGAGAREGALILLLTPVLSPGEAVVVALVSRTLTTLADFSLAGLFGFAAIRLNRTNGADPPGNGGGGATPPRWPGTPGTSA